LDINPACNACKRYFGGKQSKASGLGILVKRVFPTHSTKLSAKELADLTKQILILTAAAFGLMIAIITYPEWIKKINKDLNI
jgi:hypothetical protein